MNEKSTGVRGRPRILLVAAALGLAGCSNHFLVHPRTAPGGVVTWERTEVRGRLLLNMEGAAPEGSGPFPAVLVHPEANHVAEEMRGIVHSLAREGYLALAVDYRRREGSSYRQTLFTWKDEQDPAAALDVLLADPRVDPERIAALGYSQGGVYGLIIAARTGKLAAVVAYYPVTDFLHWLDETPREGVRAAVFRLIRRGFRRASGAADEAEFRIMLERASPYRQAEAIDAPVLLVHGDRDTSAPLSESERMAFRLRELGGEVELMVVEHAGHVFNFQDREKAGAAWDRTRVFLARHLEPRR